MESQLHAGDFDVCVVGLGYVGITLTAALLSTGRSVLGYEANKAVAEDLDAGNLHLTEPGVDEIVRKCAGDRLRVTAELPDDLPPTVIICVGTPIETGAARPKLCHLEAAATALAGRITAQTLVIVRSTVPVGTSRGVVLPLLRQRVTAPLLAFCPERTIQGQALTEVFSLPQIVGGLTDLARRAAGEFFAHLTPAVVPVSSLEAAEMIKLICNCHTDLIYGFGNEVALMAEALGLDAAELISCANAGYPRPDLSMPGFVGGGCLAKDPYLLMYALEPTGYRPNMIAAARSLNESLPGRVGERLLAALQQRGRDPAGAKVLLSGFAYKGRPATDDLRGAPYEALLHLLRTRVGEIVGHDFVVPPDRIAALGVRPVGLAEGFIGAHAALILNNHVSYADQDINALMATMRAPRLVFDAWRVLPQGPNVLRLGHA
jgi:UDP-N-acetyl-D-mannosaminuronic acid dehydrogenase